MRKRLIQLTQACGMTFLARNFYPSPRSCARLALILAALAPASCGSETPVVDDGQPGSGGSGSSSGDGASGGDSSSGGGASGCVPTPAPDMPDDFFEDTDCDHIDGAEASAVFVAVSGSDANPGTRDLPMATIAGGIGRAKATSKTAVYISEGSYLGRVMLENGISLYGGYSEKNGWSRSATHVVVIQSSPVSGGRVSAIEGRDITSLTTIDRLTLKALDAGVPGAASYAMHCVGCNGIALKNSVLDAGAGGTGVDGSSGGVALAAHDGGNGNDGHCGTDQHDFGPSGGSGGKSDCQRTGGIGGAGGDEGDDNAKSNGKPGGKGVGETPGGVGGHWGQEGEDGGTGSPGAPGSDGQNGSGVAGGTLIDGFYHGRAGFDGQNGGHGNGGGGGGGGGGERSCWVCFWGPGNGGGGGGGGGCEGYAGKGGTAGGSSFGLFLVSSNGALVSNNTISSSNGGAGGAGGAGSAGSVGGKGGKGGTMCDVDVGKGGDGGDGGKGGNGGHGGGGAGGQSFAVYLVSTDVELSGNVLTHGSGGPGGVSPGSGGTKGSEGEVGNMN